MKILFMGTPDFALFSLRALVEAGENIIGVITQPDKPKGRGYALMPPPVKVYATEKNLPVYQPENFREEEMVQQLRDLKPDICAVVAYGRILPQRVLDIPTCGCVNIHASLLPQYRGSAPYQWAVLDGLAETGVTAMYLIREMDAGDIIEISKTPIGPDETSGELLDRLAVLGADLLSKTMSRMAAGEVERTAQEHEKATYAPMLDKTMCPIDFTKTAQQVHDHVRGMHPWPVATMELQGNKFKVHSTAVVNGSGEPGKVLGLTKTGLVVACGEGAVEIRVLQAEGGKRMAAPDYFRGHPLEA